MATVFRAEDGVNGTGVAVITVTRKDPGFRLKAWTKDFGMEAAPQLAPFLICPEVGMPGPSPVVVLQDGTVGTMMVPKQT